MLAYKVTGRPTARQRAREPEEECVLRSQYCSAGHTARCPIVPIRILDPVTDPGWQELSSRHGRASVFHTPGWLEALRLTYRYRPFVLTSGLPGAPLEDGIVLCRIASWITGARAVSLPFSDHCEPLLRAPADIEEFAEWLRGECNRERWNYVELRPVSRELDAQAFPPQSSESYWLHTLSLAPSLDQLHEGLHKDSIRRKIRRAEREQLSYESGTSERLVNQFYGLMLKTRRRHGVVPQPKEWFRNLVHCLGNALKIRVASKGGIPAAAVLTLEHRSTVVYKYGCSDERFHNLGGMPFLFWNLIRESKQLGAQEIDFGRSGLEQKGLTTFKERLGAMRQPLSYLRYIRPGVRGGIGPSKSAAIRGIFSALPNPLLSVAGKFLYRHMG